MASPSETFALDGFSELADDHRREILSHCYRMLGSWSEAEDVTQEVLLRAWRGRDRFEGRASFRTWLYKIATNACLTALGTRPRRSLPQLDSRAAPQHRLVDRPDPDEEYRWVEPFPDAETLAASRQSVTLAFVVAVQHLPARQRAVLLLREVVGYEAQEVAAMLKMTIPAVNSALARARARLARTRRPRPAPDPSSLDADQRHLLRRYVKAWERGDVEGLVSLLSRDAIFSMPPVAAWFRGPAGIAAVLERHVFANGRRFLLRPTFANGQPAFGLYKRERGEQGYVAHGIQVLSLGAGRVRSVVSFLTPRLVPGFRLPSALGPRGEKK